MISVIHPTSHFGPSAGAVGGSRVPAFPGFTTGQTALMQTASSSHDQISDLYRRRSSGYTHHVSNSSWMTTSASIAASAATAAGPTPASSTSGAVPRGPPVAHSQQQQQPPRAVSSRSLSSYSSVSTHTTGRQQPTLSTVVASNIHPSRQQPTSSSTIASSTEVGQIKPRGLVAPPPGKDFSKPLFVDCSIEYELPNAPKIPKNSLPILMIHPGYQEKKRQQIQREQQIQQQQQQQQRQQQQQQLLMNIKNKDNIAVNNSKQTGCTAPNCHCRKIVSSMKPGTKRSYSNALGSNASTTTTQAQFYKQQQQQQQQLLQQQQKNRPAPPAHHAYFEAQAAAAAHANASSMSAASEAKRSRMMASVEQQKQQQQQQQHQLLQYNHQQLFRAQMQAAAALRHYQQSFGYTTRGGAGSATMNPQVSQPQIHPSVTSARAASTSSNQAPTTLSRPDMMRISSFQQITPPESLAFWQQQQQLTSSVTCRSACCANAGPAAYTNCTPVRPAVCCYPTPMVTGNPTGTTAGFCIGCAQGKCQVNVNKENLGIMRSL